MSRRHFLNAARATAALLLGLGLATTAPAQAGDARGDDAQAGGSGLRLSASAFGTLGWAQSDQPWAYQRHLDEDGTLRRDSVFGAQLDAQFTPEWSATVQARLAPSTRHESRWDLRASWAFAAWRPNNDWLLRLGKLRAPLFLRSEQLDVGQTYAEMRLPAEIYTLAPTNDFTGPHLTRTWNLGSGEFTAEAYRGSARLTKRTWLRQGLPPQQPAGHQYTDVDTTLQGLVGTWRAPDYTARVGLHHSRTERVDGQGFSVRPVWAPLGPGIGYWQTEAGTPGPGAPRVAAINNVVLSLGGEARWGAGWRVSGELVRILQRDVELGNETTGANLTLYRQWGAFTPYLGLSSLRSSGAEPGWQRTLDSSTVPAMVPGAGLLNGLMRVRADGTQVYDQWSLALGSAYALSPRHRLKLEWLHTRARVSSMIDVPAGEPLERPRRVNVLSFGMSFVY